MTVTVDLDALQAAAGIRVPLLSDRHIHGTVVTGEPVTGFDGIRGCELVADVLALRGQNASQVTVTVEQSTDGDSWSSVHSFVFTGNGSQAFSADAPDDRLRVVCTPGGGLREAVVSVVAVPVFVDEAGAPGSGTVSEVTSEDESVTITNPTGPTVDLSVTGGSQPDGSQIEYVIPFAYNTPDILDGIVIYTPAVGSRIMAGSQISVPDTPFDGTTPNAYVYVQGFDPNDALFADTLDSTDGETGVGLLRTNQSPYTDWDFSDGTPLVLQITDGAGGDPNDPTPMTQGEGEVRLITIPAKGTTPP